MKWPKQLPVLSQEQKNIREDFMMYWHQILGDCYPIVEEFNHRGAFSKEKLPENCITLEIGAGIGGHIQVEDLGAQDYYALELRPKMAKEIKKRFPAIKAIVGDIQKLLDFQDHFFHRIVAVHVLEHLANLPAALSRFLQSRRWFKMYDLAKGNFLVEAERGL